MSLNWSRLYLSDNAFPMQTPPRLTGLVWADMRVVKGRLERVWKEAFAGSSVQVVLLQGAHGGGKTHAAFYYRDPEHLPLEGANMDVLSFYLRMPKQGAKADVEFYRLLMEALDINQVTKKLRNLIEEQGAEEIRAWLQSEARSKVVSDAVLALALQPQHGDLIEAYFLEKCSTAELRKLKLPRNLTSIDDRINVLASFIRILTGQGRERTRCMVWIDEMEDIILFTAREFRPFVQALRDLIDRVPEYLTFCMNFTFSNPEAEADIQLILGEALDERITHRVTFNIPNEEEGVNYVQEMLAFKRLPDAPRNLDPLFPFTVEGLEDAVRLVERKTPRELNRCVNDLFNFLLHEHPADPLPPVDAKWVQDWEDKRLAAEEE